MNKCLVASLDPALSYSPRPHHALNCNASAYMLSLKRRSPSVYWGQGNWYHAPGQALGKVDQLHSRQLWPITAFPSFVIGGLTLVLSMVDPFGHPNRHPCL